MRILKSMYWNNIDPKMVALQKAAAFALGLDIQQDNATGIPHGVWLDNTLNALGDQDTILFLDIDCIPINAEIVEKAFLAAESGEIFGAAQAANHIDPTYIYAGPMFLCVSKITWNNLGRPSLQASESDDVGMHLSKAANAADVPINLIWPTFTCCPRWPMGRRHHFGIGTFYEGAVFHLFESRHQKGYGHAFRHVSNCVIHNREIDYIGLHAYMNSVSMAIINRWHRIVASLKRNVKKLGLSRQVSK